ncbi:MAG: glycosyltransferase [Bacteroidetes bacterium]|nr:glycosyltransferase [Bacteroidota bacterium]MDA0904224.1 glycosyltransferase [Bacteroidota bacterium]MDA1242974.1 glycosyltransferase [Bacteroidota bacterium]
MKLFVITSRIPFPLEKGDKLRLYHQLQTLGQRHQVVLCCLSDKPLSNDQRDALTPLVDALHVIQLSLVARLWRMAWAWLSAQPFQVTWFTDPRGIRQVHAIIEGCQPDVVYCQLVRCAEYVRTLHHLPKVLDYMDAFSAGMHRRSHQQRGVWRTPLRWMTWLEGNRLAAYESRMMDYFDATTIISGNDRLLIPHRERDNIHVVPNGVDLRAFTPRTRTLSSDHVILFTGNMSYPPNVDAAIHLAQDILPLVNTPVVRLVLAGAEPKPRVQALASPRVTVTGWVDDIAEEYRAAHVFVAPLRMGTGLQNKVLEAMASNVPCVLSPHAFTPLGIPAHNHAVICSDAQSFASAIDDILANPDKANAMASQARTAIQNQFSWEAHNHGLDDILTSVR